MTVEKQKDLNHLIENILDGIVEFDINYLELQEQHYCLKMLRLCGFDISQ